MSYNVKYRQRRQTRHKQICNFRPTEHTISPTWQSYDTFYHRFIVLRVSIQAVTQLHKNNYVHKVTKQKVAFMAAAALQSRDVPFPTGQPPVVPLSLCSAWTRPSACFQTSRTESLSVCVILTRYLAQIYRLLHILTPRNLMITACITSLSIQKHCILHTECMSMWDLGISQRCLPRCDALFCDKYLPVYKGKRLCSSSGQ